jgi:NAD(P)H-dependent FMN reductase
MASHIGIVIGSTRPGRVGDQIAKWVEERAARRQDATFAVVDLCEHRLPLLDEPVPAALPRTTDTTTLVAGLPRSRASTASCS